MLGSIFRLTHTENSINVLFFQVPAAQLVLLICPTFKKKYLRFDNCGRSWAGWCPRRSNGATGTRTVRGTSAWSLGYTRHMCSSCCIPKSNIGRPRLGAKRYSAGRGACRRLGSPSPTSECAPFLTCESCRQMSFGRIHMPRLGRLENTTLLLQNRYIH